MLTLANARIRRGSQVLLDEATVTVFRGEKVGIVGRNGCGKSTLLALIRGEVTLDAGEYGAPPRLAIATVAQDLPDTSTTLVDFVLEGDEELAAVAAELQQAEAERFRHAHRRPARALRSPRRLHGPEPRRAAGRRARL